jgi:5,10-methylene-tetrahydrofolate dehydrogenase/methenyl tetrahydrofolate cyclohydrolase
LQKKITPVPGGVGPMTIACLMHNTVKAAYNNKKQNFENILGEIF